MIGSYILVAFIALIVGTVIGGCYFDTFKIGAEWMQKKMIDKACEWLMHNVNRYINDEGADYFRIEKTLFDHFRKAMEE